ALSPDGTRLAFAGAQRGGKSGLWVRPMDEIAAQKVAGTEGASYPFWSPDGRSLGFFADGQLKRVAAGGGTAQSLCEAQDGRGASWSGGGTIVFPPSPFGGLFRVSESGGPPVAVTTAESKDATHRNPHFLPDGRRVLFLSGSTFQKGELHVV